MRALAIVMALGIAAGCERVREAPLPVVRDAAPIVPRESIDFVLAIDLSKSMEETDLPPDRLGATQQAARQFLREVEGDRVGVVIYAAKTLVRSPLTRDRKALDDSIAKLTIGDVPELGTALGDGLALAVDQLKDSTAKKRIVIVLADGENNWVTKYDPDQASALAKSAGIKVHTVLVGNENGDPLAMPADPKQLQAIAAATGGTFYRAANAASFERGLHEIVVQSHAP